MFVTFIGLVSASILPTVSLAVGSMSGTGKSVQKINELHAELAATVKALFRTLLHVGIVFALLLTLSFVPEFDVSFELRGVVIELPDVGRRVLQAIAFGWAAFAVWGAHRVPNTFLRVLEIKRNIAVHEAREELGEKAPSAADIKSIFPTKEGFGKTVGFGQGGK
jgi:hypothetical protein